jgi:hypothetical protein
MKTLPLFIAVTAVAVVALAQAPSDADIQAAIERGKTTPAKKLWDEIKKKQQYRINRAGFGDPIEKKVLILSDLDRIALEAAEAKRQLREISVDDIKKNLPLGVIDVLLEANCYNNLYAGSLPKWGPSGGVHLVLKVGEKVIQPLEKRSGESDSVSILPQEHTALYPGRETWSRTRRFTEAPSMSVPLNGRGSHSRRCQAT